MNMDVCSRFHSRLATNWGSAGVQGLRAIAANNSGRRELRFGMRGEKSVNSRRTRGFFFWVYINVLVHGVNLQKLQQNWLSENIAAYPSSHHSILRG